MRLRAVQALQPLRLASPSSRIACRQCRLLTQARAPPPARQKAALSTGAAAPKPAPTKTFAASQPARGAPAQSPAEVDSGLAKPGHKSEIPVVPTSFADSISQSSSPVYENGDANGNGNGNGETIDWASSYHGLGTVAFSPEIAATLMRPLESTDIEIKPDGIVYLPEIKYRRILNAAFGPGGWGLAPRGELIVGDKVVTREYALIVHGRFVALARGECQYFSQDTIPTAGEGCKSNALMRCCKDLGVASELWDPRFIRQFKKQHAQEVWVEHVTTKKKRQIWVRKDGEVSYPYALARK